MTEDDSKEITGVTEEFANQIEVLDSNDDFDGDKIPNLYEYQNGLQAGINDTLDDLDNDTLSNFDEYLLGTSPRKADTDNDGWGDGIELLLGTNPLNKVSNPFSCSIRQEKKSFISRS